MLSFCTLFDSFYLDKGIALANSLNQNVKEFMLYIYAIDKKAYDILQEMNIQHVKVILFDSIINEELEKVKTKRTRAEFCWTCTPYIIEYTFVCFDVDMCTYVDADLYFYMNPQILIDEMVENNCSVQIVEHRFPNNKKYREIERGSGRFCVQFNTFCNDKIGRLVLKEWGKQCLECCTSDWNNGTFGDQKYLMEWKEKYQKINILGNHGGGMAPWNIGRYELVPNKENAIRFKDRVSKKTYNLVFYHFHDLHFIDADIVNTNLHERHRKIDQKLYKKVYLPYLLELRNIRNILLQRYDLNFNDNWKKEKTLLWKHGCVHSILKRIKCILRLPISIYEMYIKERKDIIDLSMYR